MIFTFNPWRMNAGGNVIYKEARAEYIRAVEVALNGPCGLEALPSRADLAAALELVAPPPGAHPVPSSSAQAGNDR